MCGPWLLVARRRALCSLYGLLCQAKRETEHSACSGASAAAGGGAGRDDAMMGLLRCEVPSSLQHTAVERTKATLNTLHGVSLA